MKFLIALSLAVSMLCFAEVQGASAGYHYYPDLSNLEETINGMINEAQFLDDRVAMTQMQKADLDTAQAGVNDSLSDLSDKNAEQYGRIKNMFGTLKVMYHRVGAVEARLAAAMAVASRLKPRPDFLQEQVDALHYSNVKQDATMDEIQTTLTQSAAKLTDKLNKNQAESQDEIQAVQDDINNSEDHASTRTCFTSIQEVEIDVTTGEGTEEAMFPADTFSGNDVPSVLCALQGTVSDKDPTYTKKSHGGYGYDDDRERLAVTVDCKAFEDKVTVKAFDQSAGKNNKVFYAYVEVRACSYAAQAGF